MPAGGHAPGSRPRGAPRGQWQGAKNREVPVASEMFLRLERWWKRQQNPRDLFPGLGSGWKAKYGCRLKAMREARHPMNESGVQRAMKAAVLSSRLTKAGFCCHGLLHSDFTHWLEEGVSLRQLQSCLGHSSIEVTPKYLHLATVSETKVQEALRRHYVEVISGSLAVVP
ncbi:MAG: tyrosine-type recombinase/integrase [Verrucomicrobiota bacterium]